MKDLITSVIMLVLSVFVYVDSAKFHDSQGGIIGDPAFYPRILALILGAMAIALLVNTLRKRAAIRFTFNKELVANIGLFFILVVGYLVALDLIGFIVATILFSFASILLFGGTLKMALISMLPMTFVIYFVFSRLLSMQLPVGNLFR